LALAFAITDQGLNRLRYLESLIDSGVLIHLALESVVELDLVFRLHWKMLDCTMENWMRGEQLETAHISF
jgi:hypothetical protein